MSATPALSAWGRGDIYTLVIAVVVFVIACLFHRHTLMAQGAGCVDTLAGLMGSSLSVGPLLMIVIDPFNKKYPFIDGDLLQIVVNEARLALWLACFISLLSTAIGLLKSRRPARR